MPTTTAPADWLELAREPQPQDPLIDPQRRLRWITRLFVFGALVVLSRVVYLELTQGDTFREVAAQPIVRRQSVVGIRGRILARDGTVLAIDQESPALAVHYRYLQSPPDRHWLRRQARARLTSAQRRNAALLKQTESQILQERRELHERLARLCGISTDQWRRRAERIQLHVERIARGVNERQQQRHLIRHTRAPAPAEQTNWDRLSRWIEEWIWRDDQEVAHLTVAEELDHHVIAEDVSLEVVAEVEGHPDRYPGVRIEPRRRRHYPHGSLASHVLGHLGPVDAAISAEEASPAAADIHPDDRVGRMGLELQYDRALRAHRGELIQLVHRTGEIVESQRVREPGVGQDVTLSLDLTLQRTAEALLDEACRRRDALADDVPASGGSLVVLDVHSGAVLAAASSPRFDPNLFSAPGQEAADREIARLLADQAHPLLDRATRMAIAPGSIFKPIAAVALMESAHTEPSATVHCQGFLHRPDAQRCAIYTRQGIGHGDVSLSDALAVSCNVYFFQRAGALGPQPLGDWAARFGLGQPTGIDLPGEAAGDVPRASEGKWNLVDTQALAIGQSRLTVTPLQMARAMAALANGGRLVHPHLLNSVSAAQADSLDSAQANPDVAQLAPPRSIEGLSERTLAVVGESLHRVVADPQGTAHETVYLDEVSIAGKTGTAQVGPGVPDHAWFAAYCPADAPKVAIVVALEHAGYGSQAAGPLARQIVQQMRQLGYFRSRLSKSR